MMGQFDGCDDGRGDHQDVWMCGSGYDMDDLGLDCLLDCRMRV
jgi:hypothetical protein